ncbi:thioredoxin [Cytobacillus horneckiae]|uniref:Thioredoxin n=1 Tax=Cytobacillus horneckiae TaxID=549687 RepID=A0A2N0ZN69_9BACI|nr:thioredoxin family protein [Cytobacillus horneckiae]NRG43697.1 thioredoxin family protein [Bacillus sp. CRN 9]MBN6889117.1 thioredoxin family protein [Cytobacillus horneckiae]MCM3180696.1 thioredoxin family protein [Cytobacillus horneckiae]MEC1158322.1 thioredoxin family protein [Cytobacillus horneckiae]MED2936476.1 thioredoxin family protein [Cytobacillus horneckiae]
MHEWSQQKLNEVIERKQSALFYLYTPMCGTCQVASKMLAVAEELLPDVTMGKADLNFLPEVAENFEIESVPCLIMLKEGMPIEKIYAFQSVPYLLDKIKTNQLA